MGRKNEKVQGDQSAGFGGTLADLLKAKGLVPGESAPVAPAPAPPAGGPLLADCRLRVRHERKGRGGKIVTLVEGLEPLGADAREDLARRLRKALGCGAVVEGETVVVQGDQRPRVAEWLTDAGAKRVAVSR